MENAQVCSVIDPQGNACNSHIPYCGYTYEVLRDMADNGYTLQIDGKAAKFPSKAEFAKAQLPPKKGMR